MVEQHVQPVLGILSSLGNSRAAGRPNNAANGYGNVDPGMGFVPSPRLDLTPRDVT